MKSLNQMGLDMMFNDLIRESAKNNTLEFNNYVYQILDDYKESFEMEQGNDTVRLAYMTLSDLF